MADTATPRILAMAGSSRSGARGAMGGMRALGLVRQFLGGNFQMLVLPRQLALGRAHEAFDDGGAVRDARQQATLEQVATGLVRLARAD